MFMHKRGSKLKLLLIPIAFAVLLLVAVPWFAAVTGAQVEQETLRLLEENIRRMAVQSYALEGRFPQTLGHLEENYGLHVDHARFLVHYRFIADNLPPEIMVFAVD